MLPHHPEGWPCTIEEVANQTELLGEGSTEVFSAAIHSSTAQEN